MVALFSLVKITASEPVDQANGNTPTNKTPNQTNSALGLEVEYGLNTGNGPQSGDILLKGEEVGRTGSLGWLCQLLSVLRGKHC